MDKPWLDMTEDERVEWGMLEFQLRQNDIARVKRGELALEDAQQRAKRRRNALGPSPDALQYVK